MRINIELTPELLAVLNEATVRQILLDMLADDNTKVNVTIQPKEDKLTPQKGGIEQCGFANTTEDLLPETETLKVESYKKNFAKNKRVVSDELLSEIKKKYIAGAKIKDLCVQYNLIYSTLHSALHRKDSKKKVKL